MHHVPTLKHPMHTNMVVTGFSGWWGELCHRAFSPLPVRNEAYDGHDGAHQPEIQKAGPSTLI